MLHHSYFNNNPKIFEYLLYSGADPTIKDRQHKSVLDYIFEEQNIKFNEIYNKFTKTLLIYGLNKNSIQLNANDIYSIVQNNTDNSSITTAGSTKKKMRRKKLTKKRLIRK